jgi:LEA14-like dessication related protein
LIPGLAALLLLLPGCALLQGLFGISQKPTAEVTGVRLADLSLTDITLIFDVTVKNPYTVALPVVNLDYKVASQAQPFLQGSTALQSSIPAGGSQVFPLSAKVVFLEVLKVLQSVRPGAMVPYQAELGISLDVPQLGRLRLPLQKDGQIPIPTIPDVSVASVNWQNLSLAGASGVLKIRVGNTNQFPVDISSFQYAFRVAGFDLARGALANAASLVPGASQEIGIGVNVSTAQAGLAIVRMLQGSGSPFTLGGALAVGTPFGPLNFPLNLSGNVPFLK